MSSIAPAVVRPGEDPATGRGRLREVLGASLGLGLTSFGGPIAHLAYFRREYVERRRWLDEASYADLVALCQFLPGPASSQLGIAIGTQRAGILGGLVAWLGFTAPSAVAMIAFGLVASSVDLSSAGWVHGLKLAAVAVVAQAVVQMARSLAPDWRRRLIALGAAAVALGWSSPVSQVAVIVGAAAIGWAILPQVPPPSATTTASPVPRRVGVASLVLLGVLLAGLPVLRAIDGQPAAFLESYVRAGALVFGGGHVVLPLLYAGVVGPGWVTDAAFVAGYGAAQAVPGPLFTFAAYLGTVAVVPPNGIVGGLGALGAIFLPSFLLVYGTLPFWDALRASRGFRRALAGTNAAVVGILLAALYSPIWTSAIGGPADVLVAGAGLALLTVGRLPPIAIVVASAVVGQVLGTLG